MHELPLVFFTVFSQVAVGIVLITFISNRVNLSDEMALKRTNLVALILMILALFSTIFHFRKTFKAISMFPDFEKSLVSNEVIFCGLFICFLALTVFFSFIKKNHKLVLIFNILSVIAGLLFVWSLARIYQTSTIPAWNTSFTSMQMWATVFVGGGAFSMLLGARRLGAFVLFLGVIFVLLFKPYYFSFLGQINPEIASAQSIFWAIELICLIIGLFAAAFTLFKKDNFNLFMVIGSFAILVGELASRMAFYNLWSISM